MKDWIKSVAPRRIESLMATVGLVIFAAFIVTAILADHSPRRYYVASPAPDSGLAPCVFAEMPWDADNKVFCSPDPDKVVDLAARLNTATKAR